jgi:hypothetical protein
MSTGKTYSTKYLLDSNNNRGSEGQILSTTSTGIDWVDANSVPGTGLWVTSGNSIYNSNSGNVGIGTTSPAKQLVVRSSAPWIRIEEDSASNKRLDLWVDPTSAIGYIGANQSAQQLSFQTGSSDRIRILNNGNVGIGTTAPGAKLVISGGGGAISDNGFQINSSYGFNGTGVLEINPSATSHIPLSILSKNGQTANLVNVTSFGGTAGNLFNVQSSGNVGIGTDSPTARLDILTNSATGNGDIDKHIRFRADNGEQRFNFKVGQSGNAANLGMYDGDEVQKVKIDTNGDSYFNGGNVGIGTTSPTGYRLVVENTSEDLLKLHNSTDGLDALISFTNPGGTLGRIQGIDNGGLGFDVGDNAGGIISNAMFVKNNGNVGIGTTNPRGSGWDESSTVLHLYKNSTSGGLLALESSNTKAIINAGNNQLAMFTTTGDPIRFGTNGSERMRIDTSGNVGIGTTSPTSAKLVVAGDIDVWSSTNTLLRSSHNGSYGSLQTFTSGQYGILALNPGGGNVGIGTTSPGEKLHVDGKAFINGQIYGGFGALTTSGTLDWNDSTNARSGNGHTLLRGNATNGPAGGEYYHPFSWEYAGYDNDGNMTQFAIPYSTNNTGMYYRSRYSGTWNDWAEIVTTTKTLPGGPYLPLSAGASYPLTGDLYLKTASNQGNLFFGTADANYKIFGGGTYGYMGYNTGGYHRFLTSGVEKMRITSAGNVGIGTTTPSNPLHVYSSDNILATFESTDSISEIRIKDDTKYTRLLTVGGHFKIMPNDGVEMAVFQGETGNTLFNGGNVGIGTTSPDGKLDVAQNMTAGTTTAFTSPHLSLTALNATDNTGFVGMTFATSDSVNYGWSWGALRTNGGLGDMVLRNHYNSAQGTEKMRILANGNVGIGTPSPLQKLSVVSDSNSQTDVSIGNTGNGVSRLYIDASNGDVSGSDYIWFGQNNDLTSEIQITQNAGSFNLKSSPGGSSQTNFTMTQAGNIGIGTTSPTAAKLVVSSDTAPQLLIKSPSTGSSAAQILLEHNDGLTQNASITFDQAAQNTLTIATGYQSSTDLNRINIAPAGDVGLTVRGGTGSSSGNVGIGTTSPTELLNIESATTSPSILVKASGQTGNTTTTAELILSNGSLSSNDSAPKVIAYRTADYSIAALRSSGLKFQTTNGNAPVTAMTVNNVGNVGIGTDSPFFTSTTRKTLSINGTSSSNLSFGANGTAYGNIYVASNSMEIGTQTSANPLGFIIGGSEKMRIASDGNVGIGTTSPVAAVDITRVTPQITTFHPYLQLSQRGTVADSKTGISFRNTQYDWDLGKIATERQGSSNSFDMVLYSANSGTYNEGLRIDHAGNIAIGNDDPGAKLDVKGNYGDVIKAISGSQNITTNFVAPSTGSGLNNIISTAGKFNIGTSDAQPFSLLTNSISRIAILSDGKVGIGTTSPSQKLEVAGSVAVTGTNVTVANASNPYIYINDTDAGAGIFQQEGNTTRIGSDSNTQVVLVQNNATAVTIDTSKNVGIGTTSPDYKLEVNGTLGVNRTDGIIFAGSAAPGYGNKITVDTSNDFIFSTSLPSAPYTTSEKMRIANNGATTFTSTVTATNFILSSDERLKENIEKVCDNRVKADWKTFELKTEKGQKRYGVIAQELEKTNPEFVREDSQGFKSVAYIDLLIAKIAELEARLEKLEK